MHLTTPVMREEPKKGAAQTCGAFGFAAKNQ
jgi:hypothetical protein